MREKPKIAIYWLGACGGCDTSFIDLGEELLALVGKVDIVLWPVALDFKIDSIKRLGDGELAVAIISGCVRNCEHRSMAELLRAKAKLVLACGACACIGGLPGLANFRSRDDILNWVYRDAPTVTFPQSAIPQQSVRSGDDEPGIPRFYDRVYALNQVIEVDYYLPGCPPPLDLLAAGLTALLEGKPPPRGSTLAPHKSLCDSCPRNESKPARLEIRSIRAAHEVEVDPADCFLAHGVLCLGPATRDGCGGSCLETNSPCRGCFGGPEGVADPGARFISGLAAMLDMADEQELQKLTAAIGDIAGYSWRFTQAVSILGKRRLPEKGEE